MQSLKLSEEQREQLRRGLAEAGRAVQRCAEAFRRVRWDERPVEPPQDR